MVTYTSKSPLSGTVGRFKATGEISKASGLFMLSGVFNQLIFLE